MNLLYFIQKELYAAWHEATCPVFQDGSADDYFYTELYNYYHSLKGKTIDTNNGESLCSAITDKAYSINGDQLPIAKTLRQNLSEASVPADFQLRNWKPV